MKNFNYLYSINYRGGYYLLINLKTRSIIARTCGFYTMAKFIHDNNINFDIVSIPRMSLRKFFRDYAYFEDFEKENNRI